MYTALLHNVTFLCIKSEVASINTFEVMPRTRFRDTRMDGQRDRCADGQGDSSIIPVNFVCGGIRRQCLHHGKFGFNHAALEYNNVVENSLTELSRLLATCGDIK